MIFKFVETIKNQKIKLCGCLSKNNNKKCLLYIPGLTENFFESKFPREIGKENIKKLVSNCQKAQYDIIDGENHNFKNKEPELIDLIFNYLNN